MARHAIIAVLSLALSTACGTTRVGRLDTGQGVPLEHKPLASTTPVMVEASAFEDALARLVLIEPLRLRPPERGWLVPASHHDTSAEARWLHLMARSYGGPCPPGQRGATCLSLLDDVLGWDQREKLGVALALAYEPMKASISRAVRETLAPQLFYGIIATGLVTWAVLAANPEPVFTKSMAIVSVLMLAYLGIETFLDVVAASWELKRATDRATSLEELWRAGQRFGDRVGPQVAQVFVLAVTVVAGAGTAGGTALLASRLAMLPRFAQAAAMGASGLGINLAGVGQVSAVTVVGSTVVISLPAAAVAMAASGPESELANSSIHITEQGLTHVIQKHTHSGIAKYAGKSKFNDGEDVAALIRSNMHQPVVRQANGNLARTFDVGRIIGTDRTTGQPTSVMTIITKADGTLVTAFPGIP